MNSSIYKYYPTSGNQIKCIICQYAYRKDAPLSTLQKHLRVKHNFSIRCPLSPEEMEEAIREAKTTVFSLCTGPGNVTLETSASEPADTWCVSSANNLRRAKPNEPAPAKVESNPTVSQSTKPLLVESSLIKWILKEKGPLSIATTNSFFELLLEVNPNIILPTRERLHELINNEFRSIIDIDKKL